MDRRSGVGSGGKEREDMWESWESVSIHSQDVFEGAGSRGLMEDLRPFQEDAM